MSQERLRQVKMERSRIFIGLEEMSSKQRKAVLGLIKDLGFTPAEIADVVVGIPEPEDEEGAS